MTLPKQKKELLSNDLNDINVSCKLNCINQNVIEKRVPKISLEIVVEWEEVSPFHIQ